MDISERISRGLSNIPQNVKNYVQGRSAERLDGRMRLYPAPPIKPKDGEKLDLTSQVLNGVFGVVAAPIIALGFAPVAAYKNSLLKVDKLNLADLVEKKAKLEKEIASLWDEINILEKTEKNVLEMEKDVLSKKENLLAEAKEVSSKSDLTRVLVKSGDWKKVLKDLQKYLNHTQKNLGDTQKKLDRCLEIHQKVEARIAKIESKFVSFPEEASGQEPIKARDRDEFLSTTQSHMETNSPVDTSQEKPIDLWELEAQLGLDKLDEEINFDYLEAEIMDTPEIEDPAIKSLKEENEVLSSKLNVLSDLLEEYTNDPNPDMEQIGSITRALQETFSQYVNNELKIAGDWNDGVEDVDVDGKDVETAEIEKELSEDEINAEISRIEEENEALLIQSEIIDLESKNASLEQELARVAKDIDDGLLKNKDVSHLRQLDIALSMEISDNSEEIDKLKAKLVK